MSLFQNSLGFLPPYFGSGLGQRNFGFIKSAVAATNTYIVASGGCVSRDGDYLVHTFKSTDTLNITQLSNKTSFNSLQYLIVAGGGGGGASNYNSNALAGGGGAGGLLNSSLTPTVSPYSVVIGSGGTGGPTISSGGNSVFAGLTAFGGGYGGGNAPGFSGGSGGGASNINTGGAGTAGQGNAGGNSTGNSNSAGSGGGAGGAGITGVNEYIDVPGGLGLSVSISGSAVTYATGGIGNKTSATGIDGPINTGNGGAGFSTAQTPNRGGNGGSGIVIVRYFSPQTQYIVAFGGALTRDGDYLVRTFTSSDTLSIATAPSNAVLQYLIVAGGGGGGGNARDGFGAGGAGGGGLLSCGTIPSVGFSSVVVGAGGVGNNNGVTQGANGADSSLLSFTALGGGGGAVNNAGRTSGLNGGSGGGNSGAAISPVGLGTAGQGNNGGPCSAAAPSYRGGGGGGAGSAGVDGATTGNGGDGLAYTISGTSTYYAGGGGGGVYANTPGTGGSGVGGAGGANSQNGFAGATNRGGGGGGSGYINAGTATTSGGNGGSGIVIVRYLSPAIPTPYLVATGGSTSRDGDYLVHTFTGSNSFNVISLSSNPAYNSLEYLVVAGGGSSSWTDQTTGVGGGGAGGFLTGFSTASLGAYSIIVGAGGAKGVYPTYSTQGNNSSFGILQSTGGGAGSNSNPVNINGGSGGGTGRSGGGGQLGGLGTVGQGFDGGSNISNTNASGGGGAAQAGFDSGTGAGAGSGGNGKLFYGTYYAGGGGGGAWFLGGAGTGGLGGGANGGTVGQGVDAVANTGGGAGGSVGFSAAYGLSGGNGGSGIVIVRYFSPQTEYIVASGGSVTRDGDYLVHTFTGSDTLNITNAPSNAVLQYLIIGGGASGGNSRSGYGGSGGGGAGDFIIGSYTPDISSNPIVIGAGGAAAIAASSKGNNGNTTTFIGLNAIGGGYGGSGADNADKTGGNGASGGGGGYDRGLKGTATGINGKDGAAATGIIGGGGGGAATTGVLQDGGAGLSSTISGTSKFYSAGGGAGCNDIPIGLGGSGIGGNGAVLQINLVSTAGTANSGSGGGGGYGTLPSTFGASGGSGIVIVRYYSPITFGPYTLAYSNTVYSRGGSLTPSEVTYLNTFEASVGSDLAEFDRLWIHGLSDSIAARTSFVNPSSTMITAVNSPIFTAGLGYQSNGSTSYLNLNFNLQTDAVKFKLNDCSQFTYSRTNSASTQVDSGGIQGGNKTLMDIREIDNRSYSFINVDAGDGLSNYNASDSLGLFFSKRVASNLAYQYQAGVLKNTITVASTGLPNLSLFALAGNINGSPTYYANRQTSIRGYGSSVVNQSNFYNAVQALGTSIGWAV